MKYRSSLCYAHSGFTLIELLAVVAIVAVLSAIAAPGWLSFSNQRRANAARDQILQEVRLAQAEAQRTRQSKTLAFIGAGESGSGQPEISRNGIRSTLGEANLGEGAIALTVRDENGVSLDQLIFLADGTPVATIPADLPIKITVSVPSGSITKRCVIIQTLLGATRLDENEACD